MRKVITFVDAAERAKGLVATWEGLVKEYKKNGEKADFNEKWSTMQADATKYVEDYGNSDLVRAELAPLFKTPEECTLVDFSIDPFDVYDAVIEDEIVRNER